MALSVREVRGGGRGRRASPLWLMLWLAPLWLVAGCGEGAEKVELGQVIAALANGSPCTFNSDCDTGICEDGICCAVACGVCSSCDAAGTACTVAPADDVACGIVPCSSLSGTCRTYQDLTANRCAAQGVCKTADVSTCSTYTNASPSTDCGTCARCDGLGSCSIYDDAQDADCGNCDECSGLLTCAPQAPGASCGTCQACDGSGNCSVMPADDPACAVVDCSGWDSPCRDYQDLTTNRCDFFGLCKTAADCSTYSNAFAGADCGLCQTCDGAGNCSLTPADDPACPAVDCDVQDTVCRDFSDFMGNSLRRVRGLQGGRGLSLHR